MPKCKDCDWWKVVEGKNVQFNGVKKGRCHGRSPSVAAVVMPVMNQISREVIPQIVEVTAWPLLPADCDSCGDFKTQGEPTGGYKRFQNSNTKEIK